MWASCSQWSPLKRTYPGDGGGGVRAQSQVPPRLALTQRGCGAPREQVRQWGWEDPASRTGWRTSHSICPCNRAPLLDLWVRGVWAAFTRIDSEPEHGLFYAMSRKYKHSCHFSNPEPQLESVTVLTLPPPGTCLILSFEPHLDWTLLRSSFLLFICNFDSQKKG